MTVSGDALIKLMLAARTPTEIKATQEAARRYLTENPDDYEVQMAAEQLYILESARQPHSYSGLQ